MQPFSTPLNASRRTPLQEAIAESQAVAATLSEPQVRLIFAINKLNCMIRGTMFKNNIAN
jgi:hypothetical protein